ncbi:MAG TPA: NAD-dependent epimerase/dehydratase family protein [Clostridia bacterium]|nr:NAD-dependent epimerase/dehydratase family protein [Clostridia bacterium]
MKKIVITGAAGFIGSTLSKKLSNSNRIIALDSTEGVDEAADYYFIKVDLTNFDSVSAIIEKYIPDVIIHCAVIAHQKVGSLDSDTYLRVNSYATEALARVAAGVNPSVKFIFLSSVSVYGEYSGGKPLSEDSPCLPSSDYAISKLDAEKRLLALYRNSILHDLMILRLAPVYDRNWSLNLNRRVFFPKHVAYVKFGTGMQQMSALAKQNLVEFIEYTIKSSGSSKSSVIMNICDERPYEFSTIIDVFKRSAVHGARPVVHVPLFWVWLAVRVTGVFIPSKRNWLHSCYDKLACSLVYDNKKMLATGFLPRHSLRTVFLNE